MEGDLLMLTPRCIWSISAAAALGLGLSSPSAQASTARLEHAMRSVQTVQLQQETATPPPPASMSNDKLRRLGHASFSLLVPGWSQFRAGHNTRGAVFLGAEVVIWSTWAFSRAQGSYREDRYVEFAQQFAQVQSSDHDDDYWRAVASYRSSDEFNVDVRRDERADLDPERGEVGPADAWSWQSERRFEEFKQLRADSISAYDRADFVLVFALVNRLVSFVDALRSGPADANLIELGNTGLNLKLDTGTDLLRPSTSLSLGGSF
jgi:hypothetical protein